MIRRLRLLHYLSEDTYKAICKKFGLNGSERTTESMLSLEREDICGLQLFNIQYQSFGHIWFMDLLVNFPALDCSYEDFGTTLYERYESVFGENLIRDFPAIDALNCHYIEYSSVIETDDADKTIVELLQSGKCTPEQTDKALWEHYHKPHGTIEFCLAQINRNQIETLARCHGTALKKRIKNPDVHRATGIMSSAAVNRNTEIEISHWLCKKYKLL